MSLLRSRPLCLLLLTVCLPWPGLAHPPRMADSALEPVARCHAAVLVAPAQSLRLANALLADPALDSSSEAGALSCRGLAQKTLGDGAGMADTLPRLLQLAQRPGLSRRDRGTVLQVAQTLLSERGETTQALQILQQLLDEAIADKDVPQQIVVLVGLAATHSQAMGDDLGALHYLDRAIALSDSIRRVPTAGDAMLRYNRAFALVSLQRPAQARQALQDADRVARRVGGQELLLHRIASHRAELERQDGHLGAAETSLRRILVWQAARDPQGQVVSLQRLARIALAREDGEQALELAAQAIALAQRSHMIAEIRSSLELLFEVHTQRGDSAAALATGRQLRDLDRAHTRGQALQQLAELQRQTDQRLPPTEAGKDLLQRRDRMLRDTALGGLLLVVTVAWWLQRRHNRLRRQLQTLSRHDALTRLPNRGDAEWQLARLPLPTDPARRIALLRIDIEGFKEFNDQHGQHAGDRALRLLADALRQASDEHDLLARWGGRSLLVARADTSSAAASALAAHLQARLSLLPLALAGGGTASLTVAVGLAPLPLFAHGSADPADSLRAIDRCMLQVAAQGGASWAMLWGTANACDVLADTLLGDPLRGAAQGQLLLASSDLYGWTVAAAVAATPVRPG